MHVKQWFGRIREDYFSQKDKFLHCVMTIVCLLLLMRMFADIMYASDAIYQKFKDYYYYRGITLFLFVLVLMRKVSVLNVPVVATTAVYLTASAKYFIAATYEAGFRNAAMAKCAVWGLFLIILVDIIRTGKKTRLNKKNKLFPYIALFAFSCAMAMHFQYSLCMLCPFVAFYLTPISKRQWIWLVDCFTTAYYGAFVWVMTKSLIAVPYVGKYAFGEEDSLYYFGVFTTPWIIGVFCAGAFVCAMYWFVKFWTAEKRDIVKAGLCIMAMAYPVYATLIISSRSAEMGILVCVLSVFVFVTPKRPNAWKKRGIGLLAAITAAALCGVLLLWYLANINLDSLESVNGILGKRFLRWAGVAKQIFNGGSTYDFFPQRPVLRAIDELLSNRLGILEQAFKQITFFGNTGMSVVIGDIDYYHPHNTYVSWLMMYGWLGGIPMILWFFSLLARSVGGVLKKNPIYLFPFLWGAFLVFPMLFETMAWMYPSSFVLFFVQYPLLIEQSEE